ncbi:MAG TPA: YggS family pyridoxal phosphate-dependent enzyme [Caldithrix sp.]|nr:YggS family pyridoxal phosphate-dependent enzyme [Caldithrix sp.]
MSIGENYLRIRNEIPGHVRIVLAAKTRQPGEVAEAIEAGATDIGENYVQEAAAMIQALGEKAEAVTWHMIGELQKNKINKALPIFDVIQTIDSLEKAIAVDKRAARFEKVVPVLIEINSAAEPNKSGLAPDSSVAETVAKGISQLKHLHLQGVMTMGPLGADPEDVRPFFRKTREIFEHLKELEISGVEMNTLSMGMSDSYRVAIEEGTNMVRLGTIIFGPRF